MKRFFLLLVLLVSFQLSYGDNDESSGIDAQVMEQVTTKFLLYDIPLRYYGNILIKLQGNVTKDDSLIFKQLVDTLNVLIDKWDVFLIRNGTSNLVVNISNTPLKVDEEVRTQDRNKTNEIVKSTVTLYLPPNMEFTARKKVILYNLLNMLAFRITQSQEKPIPGSVFTEMKPEAITFHPIDFKTIKKLYSREYDEIFEKRLPPKKLDYLDKLDRPKNNTTVNLSDPYFLIFNLFALLFYFASLIFMSLKGLFKDHNYQFIPFIKQGFLVVVASAFYTGITTVLVPGLAMKINSYFLVFGTTIALLVTGMILVGIVFLVERAILKGKNNFSLEILVPFFSIAFVTAVLLSILLIIIPFRNKEYDSVTLLSATMLNSLLIGFCRSIYIYTRKMSESIVRKKDVELAQLSELQKQAEIQSLRAKINPHFYTTRSIQLPAWHLPIQRKLRKWLWHFPISLNTR
jgi:two-component system LytT family sensor kinase